MPLFPRYLDTHSHLNHPAFADDWARVAARSIAAGTWMVVVGHDLASSERAVMMAEQFPLGVYAAIGSHSRTRNAAPDMPAFRALLKNPKVVAVGELGEPDRAFDAFADLAAAADVPIILEVRRGHDTVLEHLAAAVARSPGARVRGIVHHFTGSANERARYAQLAFSSSLTSVIAHAHGQPSFGAAHEPHPFVESPCPFLTADFGDAGRADPRFVASAHDHIAELRGVPSEQFSRDVTRSGIAMFSKILRTLPITA